MRLTAAEKHEIIRLVEGSDLSVRRTLRELEVHRSTFYAWYRRYQAVGAAGVVPRPAAARRHWNRIPLRVRHRVVEAALADPVTSPRGRRFHEARARCPQQVDKAPSRMAFASCAAKMRRTSPSSRSVCSRSPCKAIVSARSP